MTEKWEKEIEEFIENVRTRYKDCKKGTIGYAVYSEFNRLVSGELSSVRNLMDDGIWSNEQGKKAIGNSLVAQRIIYENIANHLNEVCKIVVEKPVQLD